MSSDTFLMRYDVRISEKEGCTRMNYVKIASNFKAVSFSSKVCRYCAEKSLTRQLLKLWLAATPAGARELKSTSNPTCLFPGCWRGRHLPCIMQQKGLDSKLKAF